MQRAARWSLHFAELSIRNQMCSGPWDWKHTEERDLLAVLRFVLEPWAGAARMFSLAELSFRLWACPLTVWPHHRGIGKSDFVAAVVCTANLDFDDEQKVWGAHAEFSGDCR